MDINNLAKALKGYTGLDIRVRSRNNVNCNYGVTLTPDKPRGLAPDRQAFEIQVRYSDPGVASLVVTSLLDALSSLVPDGRVVVKPPKAHMQPTFLKFTC